MTFGDRKTPLKRTAFKVKPDAKGLKRGTTPMKQVGRKAKADKVTLAKSKPIVEERSGGYCEFRIPGVCTGEAVHIHHKETGHSNHDLAALAHVCNECHDAAHLDPERYEKGWLVRHR